jgi:hypothetical protein
MIAIEGVRAQEGGETGARGVSRGQSRFSRHSLAEINVELGCVSTPTTGGAALNHPRFSPASRGPRHLSESEIRLMPTP